MNKRSLLLRKIEVRELIRQGFRNVLKCSKVPAEGSGHRRVKFWLYCFCLDYGLDFHTECTFINGSRADFVVEDWKLCFEVMSNERKVDKKVYPLEIIRIPANVNPIDLLTMLVELKDTTGGCYEFYQKKAWVNIK